MKLLPTITRQRWGKVTQINNPAGFSDIRHAPCCHAGFCSCLIPVRRFSVDHDAGSRFRGTLPNNEVLSLRHVSSAVSFSYTSVFTIKEAVLPLTRYIRHWIHSTMLPLLFASALFSRAVLASAFPSLSTAELPMLRFSKPLHMLILLSAHFGNSTTVAPSGAVISGCPNACSRQQSSLGYVSWSQMSITATYTAETLLYIVNNRTNSTRTSTIKNTEINFANISTPTATNSAGTVTASISLQDGNVVSA